MFLYLPLYIYNFIKKEKLILILSLGKTRAVAAGPPELGEGRGWALEEGVAAVWCAGVGGFLGGISVGLG